MSTFDNLTPMGEDDNMSVSSLGEEVFQDKSDSAREEMNRKIKEREAEELALRLQAALQVPYNGLNFGTKNSREEVCASDEYKQVKVLIGRINNLSSRMSARVHDILQAQNVLGRDTDMICDKLESTLKKAMANAEDYSIRIRRLYGLREEYRIEYLSQMEKLKDDFVAELQEEKSRSDKEWKVVQDQLANVQDETKDARGLEPIIKLILMS